MLAVVLGVLGGTAVAASADEIVGPVLFILDWE
jgi:hypothetical protein